jgi:hypothetical protein
MSQSFEEIKIIDRVDMPHVIRFILDKLSGYDASLLESVKLLPLNKNVLLHGCCTYPVRTRPRARTYKSGYRIRASVNINMAPPFVYSHWARIPSRNYQQGWYSGAKDFVFDDLDQAAVHTLAHEVFHMLAHSRQVSEKNTEANANWFADAWLVDYKRWADIDAITN